jgi:hypothetical protein
LARVRPKTDLTGGVGFGGDGDVERDKGVGWSGFKAHGSWWH